MQSLASTSDDTPKTDFDPADLRRRFAGSFSPKPWIYWTDMVASAVVGWTAFGVALTQPFLSLPYLAALLVAMFALLRAALFIHELAHIKTSQLPGFEIVWHLLVGLPLQMPSLMYVGSHNDHHKRNAFGTRVDPEYAPISAWPRWRIVQFVVSVALVPVLIPIRWGVLAPLSYAVPGFRKLIVEHASTLVINPEYRRPMPRGTQAQKWVRQEMAAGALAWGVGIGLWMGWIPLIFLWTWLLMASTLLMINQVRTLAAHRYENASGEVLGPEAELMDSINLRGLPILTALVAPVGLRYHALHHFMPAVPYHGLGTLHRTLKRELPSEAPYHQTEAEGILTTVRELWQKAPV